MADHHRRRILELEAERNAARRDLATAREERDRYLAHANEGWNLAAERARQWSAATERAETLQAEPESHANQELAWKLQLDSIRETAQRATELLRRALPFINVNSGLLRCDVRAFLSPGGAPTFESLVAATGELPATGLASAEPPPNSCEDGGHGFPAAAVPGEPPTKGTP